MLKVGKLDTKADVGTLRQASALIEEALDNYKGDADKLYVKIMTDTIDMLDWYADDCPFPFVSKLTKQQQSPSLSKDGRATHWKDLYHHLNP